MGGKVGKGRQGREGREEERREGEGREGKRRGSNRRGPQSGRCQGPRSGKRRSWMQGYKTFNFAGQEVKGQGNTRPKIDLKAWRRRHYRPPSGRVVDPLGSSRFSIQF